MAGAARDSTCRTGPTPGTRICCTDSRTTACAAARARPSRQHRTEHDPDQHPEAERRQLAVAHFTTIRPSLSRVTTGSRGGLNTAPGRSCNANSGGAPAVSSTTICPGFATDFSTWPLFLIPAFPEETSEFSEIAPADSSAPSDSDTPGRKSGRGERGGRGPSVRPPDWGSRPPSAAPPGNPKASACFFASRFACRAARAFMHAAALRGLTPSARALRRSARSSLRWRSMIRTS